MNSANSRWLAAVALLAALVLLDSPALAQMGVPNVGGGMMGGNARPRRRLRRNANPALSPALNLVPGVSTSFGGQFLLRQVPQEHFQRAASQASRNIEGLQGQVAAQEAQTRTAMGKTGHAATFMNYGRYYQMRTNAPRN